MAIHVSKPGVKRRQTPKPKIVNTLPASAKKPPKPRVAKAAKPRVARARK